MFAVRSGGVTGVVVKGPDENASISFRMEDKGIYKFINVCFIFMYRVKILFIIILISSGPVISIKFSTDGKVLAVQRTNTTVEFMNFANSTLDPLEYSLNCKPKSVIVGFVWISHNEIAVITDQGIELHNVISGIFETMFFNKIL